MGVVIKQSSRHSAVTWLGIIIGALNVLYLYPLFLEKTELGILNFLVSNVKFLLPLVSIGTISIVVRFFPHFKNKENGHNGFLFMIMTLLCLGLLLSGILFLLLQGHLQTIYEEENALLNNQLIPFCFGMLVLFSFNKLITSYISNFQRIVLPEFFNNIFLKIGIPVLCGLYYYKSISFTDIFVGYIIILSLTLIALILQLKSLNQLHIKPQWNTVHKTHLTAIIRFMGYGILVSLGSTLAFDIDITMVGTLINMEEVAVYSIAMFIANVLDTPKKSIYGITAPLVATHWKENDINSIEQLYKKAAINLCIVSVGLFICIVASIDFLFEMMPKAEEYRAGIYVVYLLGMARIVDAITSINDAIISYSKYYRFGFYAILLLAALNIGYNYLLIPILGYKGAAIATLASITTYNLIKVFFIYKKIKIQPFSWNILKVLVTATIILAGTLLIPNLPNNPILNIGIRSTIILFIYGFCVIQFRFSEDITHFFNAKIRNRFRKQN